MKRLITWWQQQDGFSPEGQVLLARLVMIRWVNIVLLLLVAAWVHWGWGYQLPWIPMGTVAILLVIVNSLWQWQLLRMGRLVRLPDVDVFRQLLVDVTAFAILMFFADGASNPLASLLLLPVALTTSLRTRWVAWALGWYVLLCYGILMEYQFPLMQSGENPERAWLLHRMGMGVTFAFSVLILVWMLSRMTLALRQREAELATARELSLQHERVLALGAQAAGAAHELGTPLNTLQMLIDELEEGELVADNVALMQQQIRICKGILSQLSARAELPSTAENNAKTIAVIQALVLDRWQLLRPGVVPFVSPLPASILDVYLEWSDWLTQAFINLLNNAADVSPAEVGWSCKPEGDGVMFQILDRGPGVPAELASEMGWQILRSSKGGMGVGLLLSNTSITQHGGQLRQSPREGGGTVVEVWLPTLVKKEVE